MKKSNFIALCLIFTLFSYKIAADIPPDADIDSKNATERAKLLDDLLYEQDSDGDSRVPQILLPRGEEDNYVRLPNREGGFEVVSRAKVEESRRLASSVEASEYTKFLLYSPANKGQPVEFKLEDIPSLAERYGFKVDYDTRIMCHGWISNAGHEVVGPLASEFQDTDDFNCIGIDWREGAAGRYEDARYRVPEVAGYVAKLIDGLIKIGQTPEQIGLIGHSLGAHIVGIAGKKTEAKVATIMGLDPAGPLFRLHKKEERIDIGDAKHVEIHHTNGKALGMFMPLGHVDFYLNGGIDQPGCFTNICSHQRAPSYYRESLKEQNLFAKRCPDVFKLSDLCSLGKSFLGGYDFNKLLAKVKGVYYMTTAPNKPYLRYVE